MPITFPEPMVCGDTWSFATPTGQYGSGYTASITFAAGTTKLTATAVKDGENFRWSIPGSQTKNLVTGTAAMPFYYTVMMTDGTGNRYTTETGAITVIPDIATSGDVGETRTYAQQQLEQCNKVLLELLSQKTQMVQFAGQMYQFHQLSELFAIRNSLAAQVQDEQDALRGAGAYNRIIAVFTEY